MHAPPLRWPLARGCSRPMSQVCRHRNAALIGADRMRREVTCALYLVIVNVSDSVSDWPLAVAVTVAVAGPAQLVRTSQLQV